MSGNLMLAAPGAAAVRTSNTGVTIFKVADWDPKKHPRGYKGMFLETPDKKAAGDVSMGSVIATKSGKVFQVTGHGPKGIKVQSVDPDSGEVQPKGTIVANTVEVAVFVDRSPVTPVTRPGRAAIRGISPADVLADMDRGNVWPARSRDTGQIRNTRAMGDAKLLELRDQLDTAVFLDQDGHDQVQAELQKRNLPLSSTVAPRPASPHNTTFVGQRTSQPHAIGSQYQVGLLVPGTYVKHSKSGKRFQVGNHGKWTTVYPVDGRGERTGKHTVLPSATQVIVEPKEVSTNGVTPSVAQAVATASAPAAYTKRPTPRKPLRSAPITTPVPVFDVGDVVKRKADGEEGKVAEVRFNGDILVDFGDGGPQQRIDPRDFEKVAVEVLPTFDKAPRTYPAGVGQNTAVIIEEIPDFSYHGGATNNSTFVVKRVPDASKPGVPGEVIGQYGGIGAAKKAARALGENHEAVIEARNTARTHEYKPGDWLIFNGVVQEIDTVETRQSFYGSTSTYQVATFVGIQRPALALGVDKHIPIKDLAALDKYAISQGISLARGTQLYGRGGSAQAQRDVSQFALQQNIDAPAVVRQARPNLYVDALRTDFDPSALVGGSKGAVLAALRKAGYAEITPREPNMTKYVNNKGKRLHIHNKAGKITAIDEIQAPTFSSGGSGLRDFHAQLDATLKGGGDVRPLNPQDDPSMEVRTSHTRQIVFDMALGKQQGVEKVFQKGGSTLRVKSDAAYRSEIQSAIAAGALPDLAPNVLASKVEDPGLNVPLRTEVMDKHFPGWQSQSGIAWTGNNLHIKDPSENEAVAVAAIGAGERNGVAEWVASTYGTDFRKAIDGFALDYAEWQRDPADPNTSFGKLSAGQRDYITSTLSDVEPRATRQWGLRRTEIQRRIDSLSEQGIAAETSKRRQVEGTVASVPGSSDTFELPLWDEVDFKSQDLGDVESLVQNAPSDTQIAPFFFGGGLVEDGVLYAVKEGRRGIRIDGRVPKHFDKLMEQRLVSARVEPNRRVPSPQGNPLNRIHTGVQLTLEESGGKRIEYVPHNLHRQSTVASQRGTIRLYGYTPEEAAARLKDLGIVHDVEGEVPFTSIMRSRRRYGRVLPLHSDYISGDAPLPTIPAGISHGMTSSNLTVVMDSGGLLPLAERYRVGIPLSGTIPRNDIAGGVDHVVFAAISGNFAGYGDVSVLYKDSAYLRRNVLITDRVFSGSGGGNGRYPAYRAYHNKHRRTAGIADVDQNAYAVMEPAARQSHINERYQAAGSSPNSMSAGQNEWDLEGGVPIEDMAVIAVPDQSTADRLNRQLDSMLAQGRISERPTVEVSSGGYGGYGSPWQKAQRSGWTRVDPRSIGRRT